MKTILFLFLTLTTVGCAVDSEDPIPPVELPTVDDCKLVHEENKDPVWDCPTGIEPPCKILTFENFSGKHYFLSCPEDQ